MKTMYKAFFEGIASQLLVQMWIGSYPNSRPSPYAALRARQAVLMMAAIPLVMWLNVPIKNFTYNQGMFYFVFVAASGLAFTVYLGAYKAVDLRFLWDCGRLNKELRYADKGVVNIEFLEDEAQDRLVGLAGTVLYCNGKPGFDKIKAKNTNHFRKIHRLFFRFGLVEEEWTRYFTLAERMLKTE